MASNALRKQRGRPPKVAVAAYADMGPAIRREAAPGALSAPVVVGYRPDPEKPSGAPVRGAHRVIIYDWLHTHGFLTDAQREAADLYRQRLEEASGAVEGRPDASGIRSHGYFGPTERQVMAEADLREIDARIAPDVRLVRDIVGWNCEPPGGVPVERLRAALQRAAEWWGMT